MRKILVSFATEKYLVSQKFLVETARPYFDDHASYRPEFLDSDFRKKYQRILSQEKGAGFWIWKPEIIRETLSRLHEGDLLFYVDSGNLIINDPTPLFELCLQDPRGVLLFDNRDGTPDGSPWKNAEWTKKDCYLRMSCEGERFVSAPQVNASYILVRKTKAASAFMDEYRRWCLTDDLCTDTPSPGGQELPNFREHRHDQSILSLLAARDGILIVRDPSEWGNKVAGRVNPEYGQIFRHHRNHLRAQEDNWLLRYGARLPPKPSRLQAWAGAIRKLSTKA